MDSQVPTSFIPKKPIDTGISIRGSGGGLLGGLVMLVAIFLFIVSALAAGGSYLYRGLLQSSIADKTNSLKKDQDAFDLSTIQTLIRMDSRINNARTLLQKHIAPSAIFGLLSQQTLQNVQLTSLQYSRQTDGSASILTDGAADNFATVALQSDQFGANKFLKDVVFSNIAVDPKLGKVTFTIKATVDPTLINYGRALGAGSSVSMSAEPASAATDEVPAQTKTAAQ